MKWTGNIPSKNGAMENIQRNQGLIDCNRNSLSVINDKSAVCHRPPYRIHFQTGVMEPLKWTP